MLLKRLICRNFMRSSINIQRTYQFSKQESDFGIKFDEEQIRKKMEEIKNRKDGGDQKKKDKIEFLNVRHNQLARQVRKYRESTGTENLLHFGDPSLDQKPTTLQITGYDENSIEVDSMPYPPAMIIFPSQLFVWEVNTSEQLHIDDFTILKYISPKPSYVIIGTNNPQKVPRSIRDDLSKQFESVDVLELFEAVSQFNVTANDEISVVAFLLAKL